MNKFIFDVDGTLTPSRGKIDEKFAQFFFDFCTLHHVYLVTGSDKPKTVEQIGNVIYGMAKRVYNCSGSDVYEGGENVYTSNWKMPYDQKIWLKEILEQSNFPLRTGNHIEERPGMVNFSVVGRNATLGERKLYVDYEKDSPERYTIAELFENRFEGMQAVVGGDTGIDIYPTGCDKSQILKDFKDEDFLYFFGDKCNPGGNDWPIANAISEGIKMGVPLQVDGWKDTWSKLDAYTTNGV